MSKKDSDGMANSEDLDQTAPTDVHFFFRCVYPNTLNFSGALR